MSVHYSKMTESVGNDILTQGHIYIESDTSTFTVLLDESHVGGVELVLVERDEEHARVRVESLLGPVAVVHVPVEDRNALETADLPGVFGGDDDVVEDAC